MKPLLTSPNFPDPSFILNTSLNISSFLDDHEQGKIRRTKDKPKKMRYPEKENIDNNIMASLNEEELGKRAKDVTKIFIPVMKYNYLYSSNYINFSLK